MRYQMDLSNLTTREERMINELISYQKCLDLKNGFRMGKTNEILGAPWGNAIVASNLSKKYILEKLDIKSIPGIGSAWRFTEDAQEYFGL